VSDGSDPGDVSAPDAEEMRAFFALYGSFLQLWQTFELVIEIAIMKQLNLSALHASIVLCSLGFQAKSNILVSLLKEDTRKNLEALSAIGNAQTQAGRNAFTHSFLTRSEAGGQLRLINRDVKNGYSAKLKEVDVSLMHTHGDGFASAFRRAQDALGVTDAEVDEYIKAIESHT
jgi:hypothetical protein